jgi:hypothetical protein
MREEMKEDAAEEGAPVRTQTVGRRTVRAARKPASGKQRVWSGFVHGMVEGWEGLTFPSVIVDDHLDDVLTHPIARLGDQGRVPEYRPMIYHPTGLCSTDMTVSGTKTKTRTTITGKRETSEEDSRGKEMYQLGRLVKLILLESSTLEFNCTYSGTTLLLGVAFSPP